MGAAAESCARHLLGAPNVKIATSTSTSTKADHACVSGRLSTGVADRNEYAGIEYAGLLVLRYHIVLQRIPLSRVTARA
jgi:hypothetical protein